MCLPLLDTPRFFLKTNLQIISKISADLICSNYFGNKSEFRPRFKGTDYIRAKFTFDFFMKKPQAGFQTKNARKKIRYHNSRTMITCKQAGGCYPPLRIRNVFCRGRVCRPALAHYRPPADLLYCLFMVLIL